MFHARWTPQAVFFIVPCALLGSSCVSTAASQGCLRLEVVLVDPVDPDWILADTSALTFEVVSAEAPKTLEVWIDGGGTDGWQTVSVEDSRFRIDVGSLLPDVDYTVQVRVCDVVTTTNFSTLPPSVRDLTGNTYLADLLGDDVIWHKPIDPPRAIQVAAFQDQHNILLHVLEHDGSSELLRMLLTQGYTDFDQVLQEPCLTPTSLDPFEFVNNPGFRTDPQDLVTEESDTNTIIPDAVLRGVFVDGGFAVRGFRLTTYVDLRLLDDSTPEQVCALLKPCEVCPDQDEGASPACLPLDVEVPLAPLWNGDFDPDHTAEGGC